MTTNTITPSITYTDVSESVPYNFNVPVASELEIFIEFTDSDGNDLLPNTDYTLLINKSMSSLLYDTNTIEVLWTGIGAFPVVNTLKIFRRTSDVQQTVYGFRADISIETAQEVDRLTRSQQDVYEKLDELDATIDLIEGNINPIITTTGLDDNSVTTPKIVDGAVTKDKLAAASVDASKIIDGSITKVKLAASSVDASKIIDGSITNAKLAATSVDTSKIVDGSITTAKLDDTSVTSAKLAQDVLDRFDQNIPFRLSVSTYSPTRVRIESSEIPLNDSSRLGIGNGKSLLVFEGIEIDVISGNTYSLTNVLISPAAFTFVVPSTGQYATYLIEAAFGAVNSLGKTPLILNVVGGQENIALGSQSYPELSPDRDLALGYVTIQESAGSLADLVTSNLITIDSSTYEEYSNIARIRVASHLFVVGSKLIPVYWNGSAWTAADGNNISTLATHLILEVLSNNEFTLAYSGRVYFPAHGLNIGAYYFLGDAAGVLSLVETKEFSNPLLQVEGPNYFTLLGWRANEKSVTTDVTGIERIEVPSLIASAPTTFTSALADIYSIAVYNTTRRLLHTEIEIRVDDVTPSKFTIVSPSNWIDLRIDLVGVK